VAAQPGGCDTVMALSGMVAPPRWPLPVRVIPACPALRQWAIVAFQPGKIAVDSGFAVDPGDGNTPDQPL